MDKDVPLYIQDPANYERCPDCDGHGYREEKRDGKRQEVPCRTVGCDAGSVRRRKRVTATPIIGTDPIIDPILPPRSKEEKMAAYERGLGRASEIKPTLLRAIQSSAVLSSQQRWDARHVIENADLDSNDTYKMLEKFQADWSGVVNSDLMYLLVSFKGACFDISENKGQF